MKNRGFAAESILRVWPRCGLKNAEKGKFYNTDVKLNIPVYLDEQSAAFVNALAKKKKNDISVIVNEIIHSDIQLANALGVK